MPPIQLIATDLDGTLIGKAYELPLYDEFGDTIERLRRERGVRWAAVTGRSIRSFRAFFLPMRRLNIAPDYVVTSHAFIYRHTALGYVLHLVWWIEMQVRLLHYRARTRRQMREIEHSLRVQSHGVRHVLRERGRFRLRFDSDASAIAAVEHARHMIEALPDLVIDREKREIEVHTIPHTKGMAVEELARHLGLHPKHILAIGNGSNDLSMLNGQIAHHVGCPGNAEPTVMDTVRRAAGHISREDTLAGTLDVIHAVFNDEVCSDLPPPLTRPDEPRRSAFEQRPRRHHHSRRRPIRNVVMANLVVGVTILVFASHGLMPGSGYIMAPVYKVLMLIERLWTSILSWF